MTCEHWGTIGPPPKPGLLGRARRQVQKSARKVSNELVSTSAHPQPWLQVGLHGKQSWRWQHIKLTIHSPAQPSKALPPTPNRHKLYPNVVLTGSARVPRSLMGVSLTPVLLFCPLTGHNLCLTDFLRNQVQDLMLPSLAHSMGLAPAKTSPPSPEAPSQASAFTSQLLLLLLGLFSICPQAGMAGL